MIGDILTKVVNGQELTNKEKQELRLTANSLNTVVNWVDQGKGIKAKKAVIEDLFVRDQIVMKADSTHPIILTDANGAEIGSIFQDGAGNLQFDLADATKRFTFNDGTVICRLAEGGDPSFDLHEGSVIKGNMWWDASAYNLILANYVDSGGGIVLACNPDENGATWSFRNGVAETNPFYWTSAGHSYIKSVSSDPDFVDGYAIVYFYSSSGTDELRVRGKVGATETQVVLADFTP